MRDIQPRVHSALKRSKDTRSGRRARQSYIEEATESSGLSIYRLHLELFPGHFGLSLVDCVQLKLLQDLSRYNNKKKLGLCSANRSTVP